MGLLSRLFGPPDRKAFANQVARAIRAGGVTDKIDYDAAEFSLQIGGADRHTINLSNAYAEYARAARRDRPTIVQKYASLTQIGPGSKDDFASARPNLLPRVQSRAEVSTEQLRRVSAGVPAAAAATSPQLAAAAAARPDRFEHRPFTEDLALDLVPRFPAGDPHRHRTRSRRLGRLVRRRPRDRQGQPLAPKQRTVGGPDARPPPLALCKHPRRLAPVPARPLLRQLPGQGRPRRHRPQPRDALHDLAPTTSKELRTLAAVATEAMTVDRPVSGAAVKLTGTRWSSWLPRRTTRPTIRSGTSPSEAAPSTTRSRSCALDAANKKAGRDLFVAKFAIRQRKDGSYLTYASWTGVTDGAIQQDTLLPEAEWIGLVQHASKPEGPKVLGFVRLDELKPVAADVLLPTDHYPPRYHARALSHLRATREAADSPPTPRPLKPLTDDRPFVTHMTKSWDANTYDAAHAYVFTLAADMIEFLAPTPGERILDVGCGTGPPDRQNRQRRRRRSSASIPRPTWSPGPRRPTPTSTSASPTSPP